MARLSIPCDVYFPFSSPCVILLTMRIRKGLERKIEQERQKIGDLAKQIEKSESFIQGLQEALKMLPRDDSVERSDESVLRPGSDMAKVRDFLRKVGKPLHISEIVVGIGKENTKNNRVSVSGSLAGYDRRGKIFRKAGPNIFGLTEFDSTPSDDLPDDFGTENGA